MRRKEASIQKERVLEQLRTIQLLEENLGPKGLLKLRGISQDAEGLDVIDHLMARSQATLNELREVIDDWSSVTSNMPVQKAPKEQRLDREEVLQSYIELKEDAAQILSRAASEAPNRDIQLRLETLARRELENAEKLRTLL
ncbi:MAG TPA: hypothetical protein VNZ52_12235 [Candidatus Thermoplasmatota archaeon]|nr:hypothetical protein [Candidatus Thermoplasmatota archaeon]